VPPAVPDLERVDTLRDRKRAATRETIERAAIALALEHGYDNVTVDLICETSGVSPRTFFNYFGSKEGVVLGANPPLPSDAAIDEFVHEGDDVLGDFVTMLASAFADEVPDPELARDRFRLIMQTPELSTKQFARMSEFEDQYVAIVLTRYEAQGRDADADPELADEARMVVSLATGVMHHVFRTWFTTGQTRSVRELLADATELIRRITGS
jgi:AcrR family transcriptional regulator